MNSYLITHIHLLLLILVFVTEFPLDVSSIASTFNGRGPGVMTSLYSECFILMVVVLFFVFNKGTQIK